MVVIQPLSSDLIKPNFHLEQFIAHQSIRETTQMDTKIKNLLSPRIIFGEQGRDDHYRSSNSFP